jgi:hypothetical protein
MTHWNLDAASVLVAHMLNVQLDETVLDLCAAPGGKFIDTSSRGDIERILNSAYTSTGTPNYDRAGRSTSQALDREYEVLHSC